MRPGSRRPAKLLLLASLATACGDSATVERLAETGREPSGTETMAKRLDSLILAVDPRVNRYVNARRVAALLAQPPADDVPGRVIQEALLAQEMLRAGEPVEAARRLRAILERLVALVESGEPVPVDVLQRVRHVLAVSHLQAALARTCVERARATACRLPAAQDGVPSDDPDIAAASELYERILSADPDDLLAAWLAQVVGQLTGRAVTGVPEALWLPEDALAAEGDPGHFRNVAPDLGLDLVSLSGASILEDFDADGDLDLMVSSRGLRDPLRYFENAGDAKFRERTEAAGLSGLVGGLNLAHADYDNDGFVDVLVLRGGWLPEPWPNSLLRNRGDGSFEDVTEFAGMLEAHPTQTAAWGDFDGDGWLDLFIGNEAEMRSDPPRIHRSELYRNNRDGTFSEIAAAVGLDVLGFVKGVAWGDIDNDGRPDLYISRFQEPNLLLHNDGPRDGSGWSFRDVTAHAGVAEPLSSFPVWFWDYDNDGWLDLFVAAFDLAPTHLPAELLGRPGDRAAPRLYRNNKDGTFEDITAAVGLERVFYTMGSNTGDIDNDGWPDFYAGTGEPDFRALLPNRMFRNAEGRRFQDVTAAGGFGLLGKGHGVSFGDIDGDGDQDLYTVIGGAYEGDVSRNVLFENPGHGNAWITLRLEGREANRSAIGARIRVTVERRSGGTREIHALAGTGGSFGASSLQQEIGLGDAVAILRLEIRWPGSGHVDSHEELELHAVYGLREGDPSPAAVDVRGFDLSR